MPGEFIACLEWQRIPNDRMRRDIQTRRRHFFNKRVSLVNYVSPDTRPEEMLVDDSARRHGPAAGRRAHRNGGQRPFLRRVLARRSCSTVRTRRRSSSTPPKR